MAEGWADKMFKTQDTGPVADAVEDHWVDTKLPKFLRPYARLARWDRPIGWWLLLWPCWWSLALATVADGALYPNLWYMVLFLIGAVAMRGAGCTYNDLVDRDIDGKVERTRSRPIPSGQVTPFQAKIFMLVQAFVGLVVLLQFNNYTILLGFSSLLIVAAYPFMKRITNWPQFVLGLAFNWGALVGWSAMFGSLSLVPILLYSAGIFWTIGYDTIYAFQDIEDDALIGVKSTARLFEKHPVIALSCFYGTALLLFLLALVMAGGQGPAYAGILIVGAHLFTQIRTLDVADREKCLKLFKSNNQLGWVLFLGLLADAVWAYVI
ncbi:4-hydroxybenzoate octaprenyltransferase [Flexibacterium corallicola]|uniref:4-hydroxybenzoate octaprenyltransferase n=1 Tax=Flexibacterium corallicola TaxID=3037259 RepID=UPI00286F51BC|nr:4-hydroxybenzoate octaprenyltransferase [Pseudovibrio sp. M1P-2-3]